MQLDEYGYAEDLDSGIRCGNHGKGRKVYHDSAATVAHCYSVRYGQEADQRAEQAVELAYERHLEDRGYEETRAQEDYERRHGMVDFQEAWRRADLENGPGWTGPRG